MPQLDADIVGDPAAAEATLLLHGAGGAKDQLRPLAVALGRPLAVLPSLRGHGASGAVATQVGFSPLDFAADLHRMAHRWPALLDLIGYSYGALVAAVSAVTWAAPRVRSLVVLDTDFGAYPDLHEDDEWAEGSWLRWTYDYQPVLAAVAAPVLVVRSADSELLNDAALARLRALRHVEVVTAPGDHASVLGSAELLATLIAGWSARVLSVNPAQEHT